MGSAASKAQNFGSSSRLTVCLSLKMSFLVGAAAWQLILARHEADHNSYDMEFFDLVIDLASPVVKLLARR